MLTGARHHTGGIELVDNLAVVHAVRGEHSDPIEHRRRCAASIVRTRSWNLKFGHGPGLPGDLDVRGPPGHFDRRQRDRLDDQPEHRLPI